MKTAKTVINNIKDSDGWFELGNSLGINSNKIYDIFEHGEYANIEIEVDENLNIIGGRIIPFKPIKKEKTKYICNSCGKDYSPCDCTAYYNE